MKNRNEIIKKGLDDIHRISYDSKNCKFHIVFASKYCRIIYNPLNVWWAQALCTRRVVVMRFTHYWTALPVFNQRKYISVTGNEDFQFLKPIVFSIASEICLEVIMVE